MARLSLSELRSVIRNDKSRLFYTGNRSNLNRSIEDLMGRTSNLGLVQSLYLSNGFTKTGLQVTGARQLRLSGILPLFYRIHASSIANVREAIQRVTGNGRNIPNNIGDIFTENIDASVIAAASFMYGLNEDGGNVVTSSEFLDMYHAEIDFNYVSEAIVDTIRNSHSAGSKLLVILNNVKNYKCLSEVVSKMSVLLASAELCSNSASNNLLSLSRSIVTNIYEDSDYSDMLTDARNHIQEYRVSLSLEEAV